MGAGNIAPTWDKFQFPCIQSDIAVPASITIKGIKMKKLSFSPLLILALAAVSSEPRAATESRMIHGNSCYNSTAGTQWGYSQWGPYNYGNTGIYLYCPVNLSDVAYTAYRLNVFGWSRNNATKLSCTLTTTDSNGGSTASSTATVPYNVNAAKSASSVTTPVPNITAWPYITCYLPPVEGGWSSYLSTIIVRANN
jgi:hypothetical protein